MNKTVTINISGIIFHIEEDAYERLLGYLNSIRKRFSAEEGRDEIMMDIESRIAEILGERVGPSKQVVVMADVDHVISLMGEPETISEGAEAGKDEEKEKEQQKQDEEEEPRLDRRRRIFRDPDDKVIGGVCSGIGYYFDVDPVWIRIGFVAFSLVFFSGVLFYLLLLVIVPKAETTAEKLEMRREPVDVNNISRTIREEFEGVKRRAEEFGREAKERGKRWKKESKAWRRSSYARGQVEDFFHSVFRVFSKIFATMLIIFGILFLVGLLTSTFTLSSFGPRMISDSFRNLFSDGMHYGIAITALLLVFGIPVVMMIYKGIRLLFGIRRPDKYVGLVALILWIVGIIFGSISVANAIGSLSEGATVEEKVPLPFKAGDTINIVVDIDPSMLNEDYHSAFNQEHHYARQYHGVSMNDSDFKIGYPKLHIVPSLTDSVGLIVYKSARGRDIREAAANARDINYRITLKGNTVTFSNYYSVTGVAKWRMQQVNSELRVPENTVIYFHSSTEDLLEDISNTSHAISSDLTDRRWKMTRNGLQCIDCDGLQSKNDSLPPAQPGKDSVIRKDSVK